MEIVDNNQMNSTHPIWCPLDGTDTAYVGQVVKSTGDGVANLATASGAADTTNKGVPFGIVVGVDSDPLVYNSTYQVPSVAGVTSQADQLARNTIGGFDGIWAKGDGQVRVKVELITSNTVIKANIFNASWGVAPSLLTVTTGSTTGLGFTSNACDMTPVADLCTSYGRTGANKGLYRISDDTSTTVATNDIGFTYDIAVGDTLVRVPIRTVGQSYVQTDGEALFLNCAASPATDYWIADVIELNLEIAGSEYALFRFNPVHFDPARA